MDQKDLLDISEKVKLHNEKWNGWMFQNKDKPITLDEFMKAYRDLREFDPRPDKAARYATARLRYQYKRFRKEYGMFPGAPEV